MEIERFLETLASDIQPREGAVPRHWQGAGCFVAGDGCGTLAEEGAGAETGR